MFPSFFVLRILLETVEEHVGLQYISGPSILTGRETWAGKAHRHTGSVLRSLPEHPQTSGIQMNGIARLGLQAGLNLWLPLAHTVRVSFQCKSLYLEPCCLIP